VAVNVVSPAADSRALPNPLAGFEKPLRKGKRERKRKGTRGTEGM